MNRSQEKRILDADPQTAALIAAEERRQREKIILIPSESLTPAPVREALSSVFTSLYAEGYPRQSMMESSPEELADLDVQMAAYRRYADRRFYKGTEYADVVEALAARRVAECFATADVPAERIYANVQALSGAAANLAVYDAFVAPGETVMGMALTEGGHLTHGSQFNVTGKRYRIVSYAACPRTGQLDYDQIRKLAEDCRPKMIIGGFTSFPWQPDWRAFREIADAVGAILLADVAHTAGLIVGGQFPNPIGIADVVTFTTHKTLCGPRGAVILSTDRAVAAKVDTAVFPGHQGGPHVNKFAALAVALKLAQKQEFKDLQRRIVENAKTLADALQNEGLTIAYGGTNTHLLLVDLRDIKNETGYVMMGEIASRILDLVGIVCNKNTLPGDTSAADAHGIRLGTPWATQRGMDGEHMKRMARIIATVLRAIRPFCYQGLTGSLSRGKIPLADLRQAKRDVHALLCDVDPTLREAGREADEQDAPWGLLRLHGGRVRALLNEATPADVLSMRPGQARGTTLFDPAGTHVAEILVAMASEEEFFVLCPAATVETVREWLTGLADGYIVFDEEDIFRKVQGPAVVESITADELPPAGDEWLRAATLEMSKERSIEEAYAESPDAFHLEKPYFVGQSILTRSLPAADAASWTWQPPQQESLQRTPLFDAHAERAARTVPFAGWEMPVWYTSALEEHRAIRQAAGLFDLGHMGVFQVAGEHATEFLNGVCSNYAAWLRDGQSQYAYLLDPQGEILDDIFVYRRARDRYLLVVNAANERKDWAWLNAVNDGSVTLDPLHRRCRLPKVQLRDLKAERGVVDLALQGPASPIILGACLSEPQRRTVMALPRTAFCEMDVDGHQMIIARTGYTGEEQGYEIYVAGDDVRWLWDRLLDAGLPLGISPCGLAARDSTRTEAGLPLYGHELGGPHHVNPFEAGFGSYVKLHKPFFIGRRACVEAYQTPSRNVIRFAVEKGARRVNEHAAVVDRTGAVIGQVTSCVSLGDTQIGLALVHRTVMDPDTSLLLLNPPRDGKAAQPGGPLTPGDRIIPPIEGKVLPRFMARGVSLPASGDE